MNRLVLILTTAGVCVAQNGFNGPSLGLIRDEANGEIHRIAGIAGAARMVPAEGQLAVAAVHAGREWVLGSAGGEQPLVFGAERTPVKSSRKGAAKVVFSETGSAAAAWFPDVRVVQVITGLPNAPAVKQEYDVEFSSLDGLAVNDGGRMVGGTLGRRSGGVRQGRAAGIDSCCRGHPLCRAVEGPAGDDARLRAAVARAEGRSRDVG